MVLIFSDAKRLIGRKYEDATVQSDMKHWSFKVKKSVILARKFKYFKYFRGSEIRLFQLILERESSKIALF